MYDKPTTRYETIENLQNCDAVKLLLESANFNRKKPVLELTEKTAEMIAAICIGLDGLPLTLLMASSWVEELGLERIHTELKARSILQEESIFAGNIERFEQIQKLIAWSYNLLRPNEQKV